MVIISVIDSIVSSCSGCTVFLASLVTLTSIGLWMYNVYTFWLSQGMPGPRPIPILGNLLDYARGIMKDVDIERVKKYGRVFGTYNGFELVLNVTDPEVIKKVFVADFFSFHDHRSFNHKLMKNVIISKNGKDWKDTRAIMTPAFSSGKMKSMIPLMHECVDSFVSAINRLIDDGKNQNVDIKALFSTFTMNVVAKCAFGVDVDAHRQEDNPFVRHARNFLNVSKVKLILFLVLPSFVKDALNFQPNPSSALRYIEFSARDILAQRKRMKDSKRPYPDMMQLLMDASSEEVMKKDSTPDHEAHHGLEDIADNKLSSENKKVLSDNEIVANTMAILGAGFETTASTLSFVAYSLAVNPSVQDTLREEIMSAVKAEKMSKLSYETVSGLKYLDAVICETLRLYPPLVRAERVATEDYTLDMGNGKKFLIPKGTYVHIPLYAVQRDPEYWDDPDTFDPRRFIDQKSTITPYTYIPFTAGPRNCVGMRFALLTLKVCLVEMVQRYRLVRTDRTDVPLDFSTSSLFLKARNTIITIESL